MVVQGVRISNGDPVHLLAYRSKLKGQPGCPGGAKLVRHEKDTAINDWLAGSQAG